MTATLTATRVGGHFAGKRSGAMVLGLAFDDDILPPDHRWALGEACDWLVEQGFEDVASLQDPDWPVAACALAERLPARYLPRYTPLLLKRFFVCLLTVAWKLAQPAWAPLACVAEELALRAIVAEAEAVLEEEGVAADFGPFTDAAFEDTDLEFLFQPARDGIDESPVGAALGMGSLALAGWFKPFGAGSRSAVHPYAADGTGESY